MKSQVVQKAVTGINYDSLSIMHIAIHSYVLNHIFRDIYTFISNIQNEQKAYLKTRLFYFSLCGNIMFNYFLFFKVGLWLAKLPQK